MSEYYPTVLRLIKDHFSEDNKEKLMKDLTSNKKGFRKEPSAIKDINAEHSNCYERMLRQFEVGKKQLPDFNNEEAEKTFLQLQKYNLIQLTPQGVIVITRKGREALKTDVRKYLFLERYEQRLIKQSMRSSVERKWLFFAVIPIIVLLTIFTALLLKDA